MPATDRYRNYVLGLLLFVYIINFVDRQIMTILLEPIKNEFGFSDSQMGLLTGLAFALLYATLGIPIARVADQSNRRNVISLSLFVWSIFTAMCGLAQNFWHLLVARIGVGIGEAGCSPPAYSLISDYFPAERRATAISTYSMGIYGGIFAGFLLGGWIEAAFGWRVAFMVVGLPGVIVAAIVRLTIREPVRGSCDPDLIDSAPPPVWHTIAHLWSTRSFRHLALAAALHAFVGYGMSGFYPAFLARSHSMASQEIGTWLALIAAGGGVTGTYLGGYLSDRFARRTGDERYILWIPAVSTLVHVPLAFLVLLIDTRAELPLVGEFPVALLLLIPSWMVGAMYLGPTFAMSQRLVGIRERAVAGAVVLFVINLIGLGLGPWITGALSDLIMQQLASAGTEQSQAVAQGLRYSLCIMVCVNIWSAYHYFISAKTLRAVSSDG